MIEKKVILLESVGSTNSFLLDLPEEQKTEGLVVRAEEQTAGRGRLGRRWLSPRGKGLYFSVLWRQNGPVEKNYLLVLAAALAVVRAVETATSCQPELKWPNDILIGRKKVGGILLEQRGKPEPGQWVVAGIGLNVEQESTEFSEDYGGHATSLKAACGEDMDRERLFRAILAQLGDFYALYKSGKEETLRRFFVQKSNLWGEPVQVIQNGRKIEGVAEGMDPHGGLIIRKGRKRQIVYAGDLLPKEWFL